MILIGNQVYECICDCLKVSRVARKNPVKSDQYRSSNVELLWGENGIVTHTDNQIKYALKESYQPKSNLVFSL